VNCFKDKVAVITVTGRGFGRAAALAFDSVGIDVLVNDLGGRISCSGSDPQVNRVPTTRSSGFHAVANYESVGSVQSGFRIIESAVANLGRIDIQINPPTWPWVRSGALPASPP
jgi:NAD(P)-dependent dehydrogenase (short-subunit alcohol dehydrogenase family)